MRNILKQNLKSSLAITTSVGCKNLCSYCPQKSFVRAYKELSELTRMSFDTFRKCIQTVPKDICLSFSGFSEPWINPDCTAMILHAQKEGFPIRVNTTLIGMKKEDLQQLQFLPFIKFVVHLPDNQNLTRIRVDETYLDIVELLVRNPLANLYWKFHKTTNDLEIHPEVNSILESNRAKVQITGLNNRAGNVKTGISYGLPNKNKVLGKCQDFHHNILLPNGDVTLCHMDWSLKHVLGNLLEHDYAFLHSGKSMRALQAGLKDPKAAILCRECEKDIVARTKWQRILHTLKRKLTEVREPY